MALLEINEDAFLKMTAPQQRLLLFKNMVKQGQIRFHQKVLYTMFYGLGAVVTFIAKAVFLE